MGRDTPVQVTHRATIQHQRTGEHVSWHARCTCGRYTRFDTLTSAEQWATTHGDTMAEQPALAPAPDGSRGDGMTRRIIVIDARGAVHGHSTDLPDMQPGDSVLVTLRPDGTFGVEAVEADSFLNVDETDDGCLYDRHGERVWSGGGLLVRVDAPEQENDR